MTTTTSPAAPAPAVDRSADCVCGPGYVCDRHGVAVTVRVESVDRGYVRVVPGEIVSGGHQLSIHLDGRDDTSPVHCTYPTGYDSRCNWCWLGANHSVKAHAAELVSIP